MKNVLAMLAISVLLSACGAGVNEDGKKATAVCNDGTYSYSETKSGTCSGHGGVRTWL